MRIKKVVKRLIALGAGATMLGATVMGAMAADLSSFPGSFHDDGLFNGYFVVGESSNPVDNLAMTDVATSMWYAKSSSGASVSVEGDAWFVGTSSKDFEMSNSDSAVGSISGENVRDINEYIGKDELDALADGTYKTGEGEFSYSQYLYFDVDNTATNELVKYGENEDDIVADFFFVDSGFNIGQYKLELSSSAESDIYSASGSADGDGTVLQDFRDTKLTMLGREFSIVLAERPLASTLREDSIKLTMMGGAVSGALLEGETQSYELADGTYEVTISYVDTSNVKFVVNGESTDKLQTGDTYKLADGKEIGVSEILYQEYAGGIHSADFFLGASKVVLRDNDITNSEPDSGTLQVGGETISGAEVIITGADDNTTFQLSSIIVNMTAEDDYFVPAGGKLSDAIASAGDDKELMFTNVWDIEYKGLSVAETHNIKLDSNTDRKYKLIWFDGDGNQVSMPLAYAASSTTVQFSQESAEKYLHFMESDENNISKNDYFIVTGGDSAAGSAVSYALQYKGADKSSATSPKIKFKNLGSGETLEYSVNTASTAVGSTTCDIKLGGYTFKVQNAEVETGKDFKIEVDLDADGSFDVSGVGIVDKFGANISISGDALDRDRAATMADFNLTITTDDNTDYDDKAPASIVIQVGATTTNEVAVDKLFVGSTSNPLVTPEGEENIAYGWTSMGGKMTYMSPSSSPNLFTYEYPSVQRLPQLWVTSGATTTSVSGGVGDTLVQVVDAAKLDTEVADVGAQNLVVVGGPCVNSVAAELMGNPADCAEGFSPGKAKLKMFDSGSGKMAMLVAGYSGEDTRLAGKVLAHRSGELSGEEMEVSGTTWSDATLGVPTVVVAEEVAVVE
ncbi:hypothetical protein GOV03_03270 [Candidatus Woesearchaeota archaeon]|nr:hypothetical protein [Candidatus Woesearchaeota archaeon]